jgi:hypothetical protein
VSVCDSVHDLCSACLVFSYKTGLCEFFYCAAQTGFKGFKMRLAWSESVLKDS